MRRWIEAVREAPRPLQALVLLALGRYLFQSVFLGLFSNGFDFQVVHEAAARAAAGQGARVYDAFLAFQPGGRSLFYMYPPAAAALFLPFGLLSFGKAFMLFQLLSHAAIWGFWAVWVRGLPVDGRAEKALVGFAVLFLFYPLHLSLQLGQSEPFILLALAVALRSLRGDRPLVAGLCLAAAIWLKLFLALLLLHLLLRRQYRALGSCAAWLAVLFAAGCCVVPWDVQAAYWKRLGQPLGLEAFYDNQSVGGFAYRAFALTPYSAWLDLPGLARGLKGALSLALLAGYARAAWRARGADHDARLLALCLVTGLLVSPHSDTHHQALLLPAFLALPIDAAFLAFYAFFAEYLPIVAYKFISPSRLGWIIQGPLCAALSLPFLALAGLWLYLIRGLESDSSTKSR